MAYILTTTALVLLSLVTPLLAQKFTQPDTTPIPTCAAPCDFLIANLEVLQKLRETRLLDRDEIQEVYYECDRCRHYIEFRERGTDMGREYSGVYWSREHGAHFVSDLIWRHWKNLPVSIRDDELGHFVSDEASDGGIDLPGFYYDDFYHQFERGRIYAQVFPTGSVWNNKTADIYGAIYDEWLEVRAPETMGIPSYGTNCERVYGLPYNTACYCSFEHGEKVEGTAGTPQIHWNAELGAQTLSPGIADGGFAGFATTRELPTGHGNTTYMLFTRNNKISAVYANGGRGYRLTDEMWRYFLEAGGHDGHLVEPISDNVPVELDVPGWWHLWANFQDFAGASVYYSPTANATFETQWTRFVKPTSALSWTQEVPSLNGSPSGNVTLIINGCSNANVRLIGNLTVQTKASSNYTLGCALKDVDGTILTASMTTNVKSREEWLVGDLSLNFDEQYVTWFINFAALAFVKSMECRTAVDVTTADVMNPLIHVLRPEGPATAIDLTRQKADSSDRQSFRDDLCEFPQEELWLDRSKV